MIEVGELENDDNKCHDALNYTKLKSALLAKSEETNVIRLASTKRSCGPISLDGFSSNFRHDVAFTPEILVAETQEVVDDKSLVTISEGIEVHIEIVMAEEEETDPGLKSIDGNNKENPDNPSLFCRVGVVSQILINLMTCYQYCSPGAGTSNAFA